MPPKVLAHLWRQIRSLKAEDLYQLRPASPQPLIEPGIYPFMREFDGRQVRFHLRVEPDGRGSLVINASAMIRLSEVGIVIAKGVLEGAGQDTLVAQVLAGFRTALPRQVLQDVDRVRTLIEDLGTGRADWPVYNLDDLAVTLHERRFLAPIQADVTLAEPERLAPLFERLWEIGIAHVHLRGGLKPDVRWLVRAVEQAEDLGMIAGVRATAGSVREGTTLDDLAQAGVDYVCLPYASLDASRHDRFFGSGDHETLGQTWDDLLRAEVGVVAEVPLMDSTVDELGELLEKLQQGGVGNAVVYALAAAPEEKEAAPEVFRAEALPQVADLVEEASVEANLRFIWAAPVTCRQGQSVASLLSAGPRCTSELSIRVEPDGSVIPVRGPHASAGNLLHDSWEQIWSGDEFRRYRERVAAPTRCDVCPGLAVCAVDCPREPRSWSSG